MDGITTRRGVRVSYDRSGAGDPLVLVHGGFSDHETNWTFVKPMFRESFDVCAIARRGRGETDATAEHGIEDEAQDVADVIESLRQPVFLLGHSHGALCALAAAALVPDRVRRLVVYEPAWPSIMTPAVMTRLEQLAAAGDWDELSFTFFRDTLFVPVEELDAQRATDLWPPIVFDAKASMGDLRALSRYDFNAERYRSLACPVLLQIGTESPRHLFVTDALAAVLPDARIGELAGQAHEGMTTAPEQYAEAVRAFLLD
jgi:pimeloyl-ACP methyl ester carboxylesterase